MEEKISIRESAKSLKKYGSTNNHHKRPEHYIKHTISRSDTLQGIALKYGVTVSTNYYQDYNQNIIEYRGEAYGTIFSEARYLPDGFNLFHFDLQ